MKLRKVTAMATAAALSVSMLAGCGGSGSNEDKNTGNGGGTGTEQGGSAADGGADGEKITIRYGAWDVGTEEENNINRRMIAEYEKRNPNIHIEIVDDLDPSDWNGSLNTAAAGGNLPDIVMIAELAMAVANDWTLDISPYIEGDEDWAKMPDVLKDSVKYGSGSHAVPIAMNLQGIYMNVDLFESRNQNLLEYGSTFEDFSEALKNMSAPSEGVVGIKMADMTDWYPAVHDSGYGWYTLKDGQVNLTDPLYIEGVKFSRSVYENGYSFNSLTDEQKANFGVESDWDAFNAGKIAMAVDPTSNVRVFADLGINLKFTSLPNGKTVIIPDYAFISKTTEHPQEAYDFLKFMSFGKEGIMAKLDMTEADPELHYDAMPLNQDPEIVDRVFANFPIEGVREVYDNMEGNAIVEAFKFTPGYANARWNALTGVATKADENSNIAGVINACVSGELNIDDYAEQLNTLANQQLKEVQDIIDATVE